VAQNDAYSTNEDVTLTMAAPGVLGNDSDPDGDPLSAILVSSPANGSLSLNADGSFTYTPNPNFNGTDSFTYQANDGSANSNIATVTITVSPVNNAPSANANGPYTGDEGSPITFDGSASTDIDGDPLEYRWDFNGDGTWDTNWSIDPTASYTWNDDWSGNAILEVRDSDNATATATTSVTINNVPPTIVSLSANGSYVGKPVTFTATITDPGADTHTYEWNFGDGSSTTTTTPATTHTYAAAGDYIVTLTVRDDDGGAGEATTTIKVTSTIVPMATFDITHVKLDFKKKSDEDKVRVQGKLALDLDYGNGVDISEPVTVTVGPLTETIYMTEKGKKGDKWEYKRPKDGTGDIQHMTINWKTGRFEIRMDNADLNGVTNPVTISIQIGDDYGEKSIQMREKKHHWDYKYKNEDEDENEDENEK
jgi:VCBS repeat-containing protein